MASQQPIFDTVISGSGTVNSEVWVDLGLITTGLQLLLGYATYIAEDKTLQFETRSNLATKSAATVVDTQLLDWTSVPSGSGVDRDFYQFGYVNTPTVVGTGTEHLWLRIKSNSSSSGAWDYILRYTTQ